MTERLIALLAGSGLDDASYTEAVAVIRALEAETEAGHRLARAVLAAEHYQPQDVIRELGSFWGTVRAA